MVCYREVTFHIILSLQQEQHSVYGVNDMAVCFRSTGNLWLEMALAGCARVFGGIAQLCCCCFC